MASSDTCCDGLRDLLDPRLFKALCDPTRLEILCLLADTGYPRNVGDLAEYMPVDTSVVSRHLSILRDAGIVAAERKGKEVYYCISSEDAVHTLRTIADAIEACCPPEEAIKRAAALK